MVGFNNIKKSVDSGDDLVYTNGTTEDVIVVGMSIANTYTDDMKVTVTLDGFKIVFEGQIKKGNTMLIGGGNQKVVIKANEEVKVTPLGSATADVIISMMEE